MECEVMFVNEKLKQAFEQLKDSDEEFYKELQDARNEISKNAFCCRNAKKELIPKKYIQQHGINNLWIYNLKDGWRLLYTVVNPNKIEILAIVLDWMSHKDYERLFNF